MEPDELEKKLQTILVQVGGDDTMSYSLATIVEAMRRAFVLGMAGANE